METLWTPTYSHIHQAKVGEGFFNLEVVMLLTTGRAEEVNNYRVLATDYETFSIEYQCLESAGSRRDGKQLL